MTENTIWHKFANVDKRIIYVIILFSVLIPLLNPIGLPLVFQDEVIQTYNNIKSFPPGTHAYIGAEMDPTNSAEMRPMLLALVRLMMELDHKIIIGSFWADGCNLAQIWAGPVLEGLGAVYGEDYVILGYRSNATSILDSARVNWIDAYSDRDMSNRQLSTMPVMEGLTKVSDLGYAAILNNGGPGTATYITAWRATGDLYSLFDFSNSGMYVTSGTNYQAGLTAGLVGGINGTAQFERLIEHPDRAVRSLDAQALGHLAVLIFLFFGNLGYLNIKRMEQEVKNSGGS